MLRASDLREYPHLFPPPGFIPVLRVGALTVANGVNDSPITAARIDIENGFDGWLRWVGVELSTYSATTNFTLLQGGVPMRDYTRVTAPIGAPNTPAEHFLQLKPSQPFTMTVNNASGGILGVRFYFYGYYYPSRFLGGVGGR